MTGILAPAVGLVIWTFVIWLWMYVTRIPAMQAAKIDVGTLKHKEELHALPTAARQVADNYNHLHEQPTLFYAVVIMSELAGMTDQMQILLAWAYLAARVVHSLIQCTFNFVPLRFLTFFIASAILGVMSGKLAMAVFTGWQPPL
jgi:hypothetical protein